MLKPLLSTRGCCLQLTVYLRLLFLTPTIFGRELHSCVAPNPAKMAQEQYLSLGTPYTQRALDKRSRTLIPTPQPDDIIVAQVLHSELCLGPYVLGSLRCTCVTCARESMEHDKQGPSQQP